MTTLADDIKRLLSVKPVNDGFLSCITEFERQALRKGINLKIDKWSYDSKYLSEEHQKFYEMYSSLWKDGIEICKQRDAAIRTIKQLVELVEEMRELAHEAIDYVGSANYQERIDAAHSRIDKKSAQLQH